MRVLILEDDLLTALDLEMVVTDAGHDIVGPASSLRCADRLVAEAGGPGAIDLAFLDVDLPDGRSYLLAERLAAASVPVVFVSASSRDHLPACVRHLPFVAKPFGHPAIRNHLDLDRRLAS